MVIIFVTALDVRRSTDRHTQLLVFDALRGKRVERMGAAGVGPVAGEGDLGSGALLQQQSPPPIEQEHGERTVQRATSQDVLVQVGCWVGGGGGGVRVRWA